MAQESSYWALELERQAESIGDKTFVHLLYEDRSITYKEMDQNANRFANYLLGIGAQPGDGLAEKCLCQQGVFRRFILPNIYRSPGLSPRAALSSRQSGIFARR